jgi:hypothetical protein
MTNRDQTHIRQASPDQVGYFRGQVDPTEHRVVLNYSQDKESPINYILYVGNENMLAELAAQVNDCRNEATALRELILHHLKEGSLKISARQAVAVPVGSQVDPLKVSPEARCSVIWFPPFYLVHAPDVFNTNHEQSAQQDSLPPKEIATKKAIDKKAQQKIDHCIEH